MDTLLQKTRQIQALEEECSMLRNMVYNLNKGSQCIASNFRMPKNFVLNEEEEKETFHQILKDMDLGNQ